GRTTGFKFFTLHHGWITTGSVPYHYPQVTAISILGFVIPAQGIQRAFSAQRTCALDLRLRGNDERTEMTRGGMTGL
ncbi:hypothetical protein, partial [Coxiella burnetii]|uniref:hypothetical protein n=1 Tax=Coxiella burnetii TaxID=777 RepID=UPI0021AE2E4B